jgi:thioredoxin-related protein
MKKIALLIVLITFGFVTYSQHPLLQIGDKLPNLKQKFECAVDATTNELGNYKKENGLLVIFSCNACPFVLAWEDRYPLVNQFAKENKVGFVLLNSNHMKRLGDDSFEAMKEHAKEKNYQWPYLLDAESELANLFGAQTTPHVFLFDKNLKLVYRGAIDDNYKELGEVTNFYLKSALISLGKGDEIALKETKNLGCSIKRK